MAYVGTVLILARTPPAALDDGEAGEWGAELATTWSQAPLRRIRTPISALVLGLAGACNPLAADPHDEALVERAEREGPIWTAAHPGASALLLRVECFGGVCDHAGTVWREGAALLSLEGDGPDGTLERLLAALGAPPGTSGLEVFARGFWGEEGRR